LWCRLPAGGYSALPRVERELMASGFRILGYENLTEQAGVLYAEKL